MFSRGSEAVSPTAHYTGAVWSRHGLSHPDLATAEGRVLHAALRPAMTASRLVGGPTLEGFLLARHRVIDHVLEQAIDDGTVSQVVEIAAGMSPRGWRFTERHGAAVDYVEADLPQMARRKREALARAGAGPWVLALDAFAADGLDTLAGTLDPTRGVAVITEGLLNYFDRSDVEDLWRRIARMLSRFPDGLYLTDLHVRRDTAGPVAAVFTGLLSAFVRGRIHLHYLDAEDAARSLYAAGFGAVELHSLREFPALAGTQDRSADLVRVIEARTA